jgi:hypothetical protein
MEKSTYCEVLKGQYPKTEISQVLIFFMGKPFFCLLLSFLRKGKTRGEIIFGSLKGDNSSSFIC